MLQTSDLTSIVERAKGLLDKASGVLTFDETIPVEMTAATLWFELQKAMANSETSELWPNEFSTILSDGMEPHAILEVTYKFFFTHATYHYKISEYEEGRRFVYTALKDHVFEGGGEVEVRPMGRTCILHWRGEYRFEPPRSPQALVFKLYFQERFFERLRETLHQFSERLRAK
jgi:hypothetical protein